MRLKHDWLRRADDCQAMNIQCKYVSPVVAVDPIDAIAATYDFACANTFVTLDRAR